MNFLLARCYCCCRAAEVKVLVDKNVFEPVANFTFSAYPISIRLHSFFLAVLQWEIGKMLWQLIWSAAENIYFA